MQIINKNNSDIIDTFSFDIFDTLITRTVAKPAGIFAVMQKKLIEDPGFSFVPNFVKQNFYTLRIEAESYIRVNKYNQEGKQDITLEDIYAVIGNNNNLSLDCISKLIDLEIDTEIKNVKPIYKNIELLKEKISNGKNVILISDMYHSSDVLRKILLSIDPIFENIKIYVSSEQFKTKHTGDLYSVVKELENLDTSKWIHYGDNKHADINRARFNNIKAEWLQQEELLKYEKYALKLNEEDFFTQSLIGISKYTRTCKADKSNAYIFAVSFAAPILFNYVNWVLNQAIEKNIKSLNFIARDGYVLKKIADIIIAKKNLDIKTNYIYGSRTAWRIPTKENIKDYIAIVCEEYTYRLNLDFLSSRMGIDCSLLKEVSNEPNAQKILKKKAIVKLKNAMLNNEEFIARLLEINNSKKQILQNYLKENIDFSEPNIAFVDVHGSGRTQDMLSSVIKEFYKGEILGFYYHSDFNCSQKISKKYSYLSTSKYLHHSIELLCRNLDGQTIGYKQTGDIISPILEPINKISLLKWGYVDYLQGIEDFANNACDFEINNNISLLSYNLFKIYFNYLRDNCDKQTADIIGTIPYMDVGCENKTQECAPKFGFINGLKYLLFGEYNSSFPFISIFRSSKIMKIVKFIVDKYGSLRKFLVNVFVCKSKKMAYIRILGIKISFAKLLWGSY